MVDKRVEAALRFAVRGSLGELQRALCGDPANKDQEVRIRGGVPAGVGGKCMTYA